MEAQYEIIRGDFYFRTEARENGTTGMLSCLPHMHYQIEFCLLLEGETTVYIDSEEYNMKAGDFCIFFPNQIHQFKSHGPERYMLVIFTPDMLPEFSDIFFSRIPKTSVISSSELSESFIDTLVAMEKINKGKNEYKNIQQKGLLLTLFGEMISKLNLTDVKSVSSHTLKLVVNYCSRNFSRDLSLGILEEELHISKYYISHLFSMKLKVRFNDYINSLRVNEACRQLKQTDKNITEICESVGFNTLRTFNRAFIRQTGMTPSEYRKQGAQLTRSGSMIV